LREKPQTTCTRISSRSTSCSSGGGDLGGDGNGRVTRFSTLTPFAASLANGGGKLGSSEKTSMLIVSRASRTAAGSGCGGSLPSPGSCYDSLGGIGIKKKSLRVKGGEGMTNGLWDGGWTAIVKGGALVTRRWNSSDGGLGGADQWRVGSVTTVNKKVVLVEYSYAISSQKCQESMIFYNV
jgi:hypothetical protein